MNCIYTNVILWYKQTLFTLTPPPKRNIFLFRSLGYEIFFGFMFFRIWDFLWFYVLYGFDKVKRMNRFTWDELYLGYSLKQVFGMNRKRGGMGRLQVLWHCSFEWCQLHLIHLIICSTHTQIRRFMNDQNQCPIFISLRENRLRGWNSSEWDGLD